MCGTSVPLWVRRSTFGVRVGGGTKADRHWPCRGTSKDVARRPEGSSRPPVKARGKLSTPPYETGRLRPVTYSPWLRPHGAGPAGCRPYFAGRLRRSGRGGLGCRRAWREPGGGGRRRVRSPGRPSPRCRPRGAVSSSRAASGVVARATRAATSARRPSICTRSSTPAPVRARSMPWVSATAFFQSSGSTPGGTRSASRSTSGATCDAPNSARAR